MEISGTRIEHNRKELKQLPRRREIEAKIVDAIEQTGILFGSDQFAKQVKGPLTVCGKTAAALIEDDEDPILFIPMTIEHGEELEPGFILTFEDHVLFAWSTGSLRLTYFAEIVYPDDVKSFEDAGPFALSMTTEREWWVQTHATAFQKPGYFDALLASLGRSVSA